MISHIKIVSSLDALQSAELEQSWTNCWTKFFLHLLCESIF